MAAPDSPSPPASRGPATVLVVLMATLMAVMLYLDRFCVSFAEVFIREDLRLTDDESGLVFGIFFYSYALAQVPAGWLTDRFGARLMLTIYIVVWSVFTELTGMANSFLVLILLRCGFGIAQAGAFPTSANLLRNWVPKALRGTASSIVANGGRIGGAIAPIVTGLLIVWLVPPSTSSRLKPGDLLEPAKLAVELTTSDDPKPYTVRLVNHEPLPSDVVELAQLPEGAAVSAEQSATLLAYLNRVLDWREFHDAATFEFVDIKEREAQRLLKRPRSELSTAEVERLNRLLLENVFAKSLRKVYGQGWRPMMTIYAGIGIGVAMLFWLLVRNRSEEHPLCRGVALEEGGAPPTTERESVLQLARMMLTDRSQLLSCVSQFFTNVGWVFVVTWAARYFEEVHHVGVNDRAWMVAIPTMFGICGMALGGPLTDLLTRRIGLRWGRALPMSVTRIVCTAAYFACLFKPSPWTAVALFSLIVFVCDLGVPSIWAYVQDVGGRNVGAILGFGNMVGNLGAAVASQFLIKVVKGGNWNWVFVICGVAFLLAGASALGIDARRPVGGNRDTP